MKYAHNFCIGAYCCDVKTHWINGHTTPLVHPMAAYPEYRAYHTSWGINALGGGVIVEVECEDGSVGVGEEECTGT